MAGLSPTEGAAPMRRSPEPSRPGSGMDVRRTGEVAVIASDPVASGFTLVGVHAVAAENADEARAAWAELPDEVLVVVLGSAAAIYLAEEVQRDRRRMTVVVP